MNMKKTSLAAFCLAAFCAGPALAQTVVIVDDGVNRTSYGATAATPGPTLGLGPVTGIVTTTGVPGEGGTLVVTGTGVAATAIAPGGVAGGSFTLNQTNSFFGIRGAGPTPISGLQSTSAGTNTLIGTTASAGLTNTGNITTDTFNSTGNASIGGSLAVTGASMTNGLTNTGAISTTTLATTGDTAVGGKLSVAGTTSTNGIDNNGQAISNVADGQAPTDAVNVRQLNATNGNQAAVNSNQAAINAAQANTNQVLQAQTAENRRIASTGTAIVAAAAAIPALEAGKDIGFGAALGGYDGRAAVSVGLAARISQAMQIKMHVGTGSGGRVAAGVGGLWSW